ncbi:MAG: aminotransferase class V-fold PLP-dependent enzyme, partial [Saprospiraceae bacterium]|nr:aminotransferase class V-fold PLP-dependent enzyme [Saprospiraceae bacterium]
CITPQETLENFIHHVREVNYQGSWYMRTVQWDNKEMIANRLADRLGAEHGEVIVTRNTTESLDTIIGGFPWNAGDEAVFAEQDYGAMRQMFRLVADRYGITNKVVSVPNHPASDDEIVDLYANAITPKTRLLMICHMINITGQILPVRKICDMAHSKGVEVMVDGAHAFAHIDFDIKALDCDYYGSSLHKWLSTPLGAGLLYIRKDKISKIWPMFGDYCCEDDVIRRLNHTGTHPVHTDLAIGNALDYHERIGSRRKEARLRYLQRYWSDQVREWPHVVVNTPAEPHRSCGIANVGIRDLPPKEMADRLLQDYRIWTVAIDGAGVHGCRISPNLYTSTRELDVLIRALREMG